MRYAHRIAAQLKSTQILPYVAVSKDAFPQQSSAHAAGGTKSFSLPKQAKVSCVSFQAQYQAFVHFAVGSGAAFKSHRAQVDLRSGTFHSGRASRFEKLWPSPVASTGPATLDRCCRRNVVAPGEYSK